MNLSPVRPHIETVTNNKQKDSNTSQTGLLVTVHFTSKHLKCQLSLKEILPKAVDVNCVKL